MLSAHHLRKSRMPILEVNWFILTLSGIWCMLGQFSECLLGRRQSDLIGKWLVVASNPIGNIL